MTDIEKDIILEPGEVLFDTDSPLSIAYFILDGRAECTDIGKNAENMPPNWCK